MPVSVVQRLMDTVLNAAASDGQDVDLRERDFATIAMLNKRFFGAYLHFLVHLHGVMYHYSQPKQVAFVRRRGRGGSQCFITAPGVLKLLAADDKLGRLKRMELTLTPKQCAHGHHDHDDGHPSPNPAKCLFRLLGVEEEEEEEKEKAASSPSAAFSPDEARIHMLRSRSIPLNYLLGLNARVLEISFFDSAYKLFTSPPLHLHQTIAQQLVFDRITTIHVDTGHIEVGGKVKKEEDMDDDEEKQEEEEDGDGGGGEDGDDEDTAEPIGFPSEEWVELINQFLTTCPSLRELRIVLRVVVWEPEAEKVLTLCSRAISSMANEVLCNSEIKGTADVAIEINFLITIFHPENISPAGHALYQLGSPKSTEQESENGGVICERELVVDEGSEEGNGNAIQQPNAASSQQRAGRKAVTFAVRK